MVNFLDCLGPVGGFVNCSVARWHSLNLSKCRCMGALSSHFSYCFCVNWLLIIIDKFLTSLLIFPQFSAILSQIFEKESITPLIFGQVALSFPCVWDPQNCVVRLLESSNGVLSVCDHLDSSVICHVQIVGSSDDWAWRAGNVVRHMLRRGYTCSV